MTIKHDPTTDRYISQVADIRAVLANLQEWSDTLPAPDENGNLPCLNYGHTGTIGHVRELLAQASEATDRFCADLAPRNPLAHVTDSDLQKELKRRQDEIHNAKAALAFLSSGK